MISRRNFIQGAAMAAMGSVLGHTALPAIAAGVPKVSRQSPGYFRMMLGEIEVTAVYDGGVVIPPKILHGASPQELATLLEDACIDPNVGSPTAINAFLVNTGRNLLLVDTGAGSYFGDKAGMLAGNIHAAGYDPKQVDTVLLTHLHSDHALGLVDAAGKPLFSEARIRVRKDEAAYWLDDALLAKAPKRQQQFLTALHLAPAPYVTAGTFTPFASGEAPAPGVEAESFPGHTPGHCGYRIRSQGESLLFWGDIVHCQAAQFPHPEVSIDFDVDQAAAVATRKPLMASLAAEGNWVAGAHLPFPGIGHIKAAGSGHVWWPAAYAALPAA
jgi:glyoxylase-like metal-dependent hydrolase (beta-lactamase superfamily II)